MYKDRLPYSSLSHEECHKKLLEILDANHTLECVKMLLILLLIASLSCNVYAWYAHKRDEENHKETYSSILSEKIEAQKSADYYLGHMDGESYARDSFSKELEAAKELSYISGFQAGLEKETSSFDYYEAYWQGYEDGHFLGFDEGYDVGWEEGQDTGFDAGYDEGFYYGQLE